jgi:signal transduction histidine kinase
MVARDDLADRSAHAAFVQARTGVSFFGQVYFVRQSEPYMRIAVPIELFAGEVIGVLIAEVNLKYIWDVISRIKVGETGYAYVVSHEGDLIAHPDISLALQKQNLTHLRQVQAALAGVQSQPIQQNLQDEDVYTTHASIPDLGWVVIVERLRNEAYAPLYASLLRLGLLLLVGLGLAGLVSWLIVRRVMRPLESLREGAERLGAGELHYRITVHTGDELEMFADTFNRMAAQLQTSYTTLEQRVAERTRELARSVGELEIVSQHKSRFLAHMSHELRTPLNAIVGYTELMLDNAFGDIPSEARENLERVQHSSNHLLKLINAVLDFSRIEAGRFALTISEYSLRDLIETTVIALENTAAAKQLTVTVATPSELPMGRGDERRLTQVWFNLVGNAITYTKAGGEIHIEATVVDEDVFRVAVTDTGPGIAREDQTRIFEAFEQAHALPTQVQSGTGLGLAICRTIIEMHGGSIGVSSTPGQGSTFWCTFPVRIPDYKER